MINHIKEITAHLKEYNLDAMLVTSQPGEFYTVGFHGEGAVIVTPEKTWYYTDSRYIEEAHNLISGAEISTAPAGKDYADLTEEIIKNLGIQTMGFEDQYFSVAQMTHWQGKLSAKLVPASDMLTKLRKVKDQAELECMKEAQRITDEAFIAICAFIKPGMTEQEIGARLQYEMLSRGAERMSFDPIVASGPNGSKPHAVPSARKVQSGEFITMDFGCKFGGYCSDMTRTVALGQPTQEMSDVYHLVLKAQLAAIAGVKGGMTGVAVDAISRDIIKEAGYGDCFGHGLGHSLGYEIHEDPRFSPTCDEVIPAGTAMSVEPGIYLPGKFGVRIEDVVVLTEDGCIDLTKSAKELIIL